MTVVMSMMVMMVIIATIRNISIIEIPRSHKSRCWHCQYESYTTDDNTQQFRRDDFLIQASEQTTVSFSVEKN